MRIGVENFDPERLVEALSFKMMTKSALAKAINVTPGAVTAYINSSRSPSPDAFFSLCNVLNFPRNFFLSNTDDKRMVSSLKQWRSLSSAHKADRSRGEVLLKWISEIHTRFHQDFPLPSCELLAPSGLASKFHDFRRISSDDIENAASELRSVWNLGELPIRNLLRSSEKAGCVIGKYNINVSQLDAVSTVVGSTPYILLNTFKQSGCRSRFDLAHEIGHVILHRGISKEDFDGVDGKAFYKRTESQAHRFAGALLIPAERFANDFWAPTIQCFIDMKAKWHVSIQALMRRALDLELITEKQSEYLNIAINRKKFRTEEPLDNEIGPESIRLFPKCFQRFEEEFGRTRTLELIADLNLPPSTVEELCGLFPGQLSKVDEDHSFISDNLIEVDFRTYQK